MDKVVVADPLDRSGLDLLRDGGADVVEALDGAALARSIAEADALLVRSRTRVDAGLLEAAPQLRVIGRVGIRVDNIDLDEATARGILVFNVPGANLLSAVEHTFALLLALARHVPAADAALKQGRWDRKRFAGMELHGKTLGIIGLGRIGQRVAARARAFEMEVVAHDPFLRPDVTMRLGIEAVSLSALLTRADVVSVHTPLTDQTRGLLGAAELARMRPGALLVNCARGGIVEEDALLEALESGSIGGAALDVFAEEPPTDRALIDHPRVVATPHLGDQTREAQERASVEAAKMMLAALAGSLSLSAVNLPFSWDPQRSLVPLQLGEQIGRLAVALVGEPLARLEVRLDDVEDALHEPVTLAVARGALAGALGDAVGYVNVEQVAVSRGVELVRTVSNSPTVFPLLVGVTATGAGGEIELAGTLFDRDRPRVVRFGKIPLEFSPKGRLLVLRTADLPGTVGTVGSLLGDSRINIADVHLARKDGEEDAWTVFRLDQQPSQDVLDRLAKLPFVRAVRSIDLGDPWPRRQRSELMARRRQKKRTVLGPHPSPGANL